MNYKTIIVAVINLFIFNACNTSVQEKKEVAVKEPIVAELQGNESDSDGNKIANVEQLQEECEQYWKKRFPNDSLKAICIKGILTKSKLSENNVKFLTALMHAKKEDLAFNNILAPIFRLSKNEVGVFTFPKYNPEHKDENNNVVPYSKEKELIKGFATTKGDTREAAEKIRFYPTLLNSLVKGKPKPVINYYTTSKAGLTQVLELGGYEGECLEYYEYSIDTTNISIKDKVLFSSPFAIDLIFQNYPEVDLLVQKDNKDECLDCPSSGRLQKSFAKVKGTDNLYFVYADTFPINDKLDTPSRALILINEKKEAIYLWYSEIDLSGCSCL